ncbi:MAG TPA: AAA family ATPase [Ilumatobacter sp.]|nr:AAA family ATPase [Ilumatobacter sp.]
MPSDVTAPRLVGRRDELLALSGLARADGPRALVLEGEPGMGKSMLVAAATALLGESTTVIAAAPSEGDQRVPWGTVGMLLPGLGVADFDFDVSDDVAQVQFAFANAFAAAVADRAVVVVIDDAQWVDPASAGALSFAVREGAGWLVARRSGSERGFILDVAGATNLVLGPMHARDLDELARNLTGWQWSLVEIDRLAELSGGNPLYARQLVELFGTPEGLVVGELPGGPLGAFARCAAALAPDDLRVVAAVALQRGSGIATLDAATGVGWEAIEHALDAAERAGIVRVRASTADFVHALARQAVLERLDPAQAVDLHRRLAAYADDPVNRAWHLGRGTVRPEAAVADELERAAERAHALSDARLASELYARAAELTPPDLPAELLRRTHLGGWVAVLGDDAVATERLLSPVIREPCEGLPARRARRAYVGAVASLHGVKAGYDAVELILPLAADDSERSALLDARTRLAMMLDLALAEAVAADHASWARGIGDAAADRAARVVYDELRMLRGERVDLADHIAAYRADPDAFGPASGELLTAFGELVEFHDHHELATELWERRIAEGIASASADAVRGGRDALAETLRLRGDWDGLARMVAEFGDTVTGDHPDGGGRPALWSVFLWAATGQHALVGPLVEQEVEAAAGTVAAARIEVVALGGFAMLAAGRVDRAVELLSATRSVAHEWGYDDTRGLNYHANLVEALVAAGRATEAEPVAAEAERIAARNGWPFSVLEAERCRAHVLVASGDPSSAMRLLDASEPGWAAIRRPFEVARAYLLLAEARRLARHPARARAALDRAAAMFAELGAQPWLDRVATERELLGRHGNAPVEPAALTAAEAAVVALVRAGRSTPKVAGELSMSPRSVESHLTRIYRKLGVRNRRELLALGESAVSEQA